MKHNLLEKYPEVKTLFAWTQSFKHKYHTKFRQKNLKITLNI